MSASNHGSVWDWGSKTSGNLIAVHASWKIKYGRHQRRARWAMGVLETLCCWTGHVGACGLLNRSYHPCICVFGHWLSLDLPSVPNPLARLYHRIFRWGYPE